MKCKHMNKMYPVFDKFGYAVGFLCDCGYFEFNVCLEPYEERMRKRMKNENL